MAKREFDIIANVDRVEDIPRDLRLHACRNDQPSVLSREQIDSFNARGYLSGLDIFDTDEIADIRTYFDDLLDRVIASGKDSYSISSAHLTRGRVYDLMKKPRIVDIIGADPSGHWTNQSRPAMKLAAKRLMASREVKSVTF